MPESTAGTCILSGCKVIATSTCTNGLPISGSATTVCPNFRPSIDDADEELEDAGEDAPQAETDEEDEEENAEEARTATPPKPIVVALPTGESLSLEQASNITRSVLARMIVIGGENDCGKTTLLACLNESFQRGPYAGFWFAGSSTLVAFEKICHEAKAVSYRSRPKTVRTSVAEGTRFLHLMVRSQDVSEAVRHVLISNTSGEIFKQARNLKQEAQQSLQFLKRADHFVLFLNGEKIARKEARSLVQSNAGLDLRRLIEAGLLDSHSQVDVLISKWDAILLSPEKDSEAFVMSLEKVLTDKFASRLGRLRFFHVAPRPEKGSGLLDGHGLEELFASWVNESGIGRPHIEAESIPATVNYGNNGRESSRFVWTAGA